VDKPDDVVWSLGSTPVSAQGVEIKIAFTRDGGLRSLILVFIQGMEIKIAFARDVKPDPYLY
ncbi:hypothetical protein BHM03_00024351, partial [Ensete ventricosum]